MREVEFDPSKDDILHSLKNMPVFESLSEDTIRRLLKVCSIRHYESGETLIYQGDFDKWVFFLVYGDLDIEVDGTRVGRLRRLGDVFGEMGIIDGSPRSATIRATRATLVVGMDGSGVEELGEGMRIFTQAVMYRLFAEVMAVRLRESTKKVARLEAIIEEMQKD